MSGWDVAPHLGHEDRVVTLARKYVRISSIAFPERIYLYRNTNDEGFASLHPIHMSGWGRGDRIHGAEWIADRPRDRFPVCLRRNLPVRICLDVCATPAPAVEGQVTIRVTPRLNDGPAPLGPATASGILPAGQNRISISLSLDGVLPDEIARHRLALSLSVTFLDYRFMGPSRTEHVVYSIYGLPFRPGYDSPDSEDPGLFTSEEEGTLSGTPRRLDHVMRVIGGAAMRHPADTSDRLFDILWKLHRGVHDTSNPPYFCGMHGITIGYLWDHVSHGSRPEESQWLMWIPTPTWMSTPLPGAPSAPYRWNEASCIGHVQLVKTMAASIGLFTRRAWLIPCTTLLPATRFADDNGQALPEPRSLSMEERTVRCQDSDLYYLGHWGETGNAGRTTASKVRRWYFWRDHPIHGRRLVMAVPQLLESTVKGDLFEGCTVAFLPDGNRRFLPGAYRTTDRRVPESFRSHRGFSSALEAVRWWTGLTTLEGFPRFVCWSAPDPEDPALCHFWDRDGNPYTQHTVVQMRERGLQLPVP